MCSLLLCCWTRVCYDQCNSLGRTLLAFALLQMPLTHGALFSEAHYWSLESLMEQELFGWAQTSFPHPEHCPWKDPVQACGVWAFCQRTFSGSVFWGQTWSAEELTLQKQPSANEGQELVGDSPSFLANNDQFWGGFYLVSKMVPVGWSLSYVQS